MKKMKRVVLGSMLILTMMMLVGCSSNPFKPSAAKVAKKAFDSMENMKTVDTDVLVSGVFKVSDGVNEQKISMDMDLNMQLDRTNGDDKTMSKVEGSVCVSAAGEYIEQNLLAYGEQKNNKEITYTYDSAKDMWTKKTEKKSAKDDDDKDDKKKKTDNNFTNAENCTLTEATHKGKDCYVLSASQSLEDLIKDFSKMESLEENPIMEKMDELSDATSDMDLEDVFINLEVYADKKSGKMVLLRVTCDDDISTEIEGGIKLAISSIEFEMELNEVDKDFAIEIPKDAKLAVEEDNSSSSIANDLFGGSSNTENFNADDENSDDVSDDDSMDIDSNSDDYDDSDVSTTKQNFGDLINVEDASISVEKDDDYYREYAEPMSSEITFVGDLFLNKVKNTSNKKADITTVIYFYNEDGKQVDESTVSFKGMAKGQEETKVGYFTYESSAKYYEARTYCFTDESLDTQIHLDVKENEATSEAVKGTVTNNSNSTVKYANVIACFYKNGEIVNLKETYVEADEIAAGASSTFDIFLYDEVDYDKVEYFCSEAASE